MQRAQGALRHLPEARVAGELGQRAVLEDEGADLGRVAARARRLAAVQVDVHVRHAGRRAEGEEESLAEIAGEREQPRVARHLVGGEQAAEHADGDLEVLHRGVEVEVELLVDELARARRLVVEVRDEEGVEGVHRRHQQRVRVPVAHAAAHRPHLVVPPGEALVAAPGVAQLRAHACRLGNAIDA